MTFDKTFAIFGAIAVLIIAAAQTFLCYITWNLPSVTYIIFWHGYLSVIFLGTWYYTIKTWLTCYYIYTLDDE